MMAFKRKFDSDIPDGMLTVLRLLHNPPLEEEILNKVAKGSLHELTPSESSNLWVTLSENLKAYFRNMFWLRDTDNHDDKEYILKKIGAYPFMTTLFFLLKMTIQGKTENSIPLAAAHTMLVLSSMLKKLKTDGQVDNEMLQVSALWTERKLASKENLCFTTFLNRLLHSLRDNATEEDICNVYNLQEWLCISDIRKESCSHIVRAMKSVNYLKSPRGRSFLSFAMTQDEKLMEDLHRSCKSHLSGCSQAESRAYGLIYLEAWRTVSVKKRKRIEEHCIRDLMELAVKLPRKGTEMSLSGLNVLTFLHEFHSRKSCDAIREMLTSQYDLFLWKQLQSSSSNVKCSATEILADAYPLERPRQDIVKNNEYLAKQHNVFSDLLVNVNPTVRSVAFRKISQIASKFWAQIPPSVLQHWISTMILRLAKDMETPQVRQSIYQGLHVLVENPNPLCTKILEKMLPELREQIADDDKRVRIAFVKLLHAIKDAGNIELWNIVPLHCLINRLEEDDCEVGELLAQLLCSTCFANNKSFNTTVNCIGQMVNFSHEGTCKFFLHSKSFLKFHDAVKLMLLIMECLLKHIEIEIFTKRRQRKDSTRLRPRHVSKKRKRRSKFIKKLAARMKNAWVKAVRTTGDTEKQDFCLSGSDEEIEFSSNLRRTSCSDSDEEADFSREMLLRAPETCQGLIDVFCILFYVHSAEQKWRCSRMWQKVYRMCKHCIPLFAMYFAGSCAFSSVMVLSSLMPATLLRKLRIPSSVETVWLSKLDSLSDEDASSEAVHLASFKCLQNYGPKFLLIAANIFHTAIALRIAAISPQNMVFDGKFKKVQYKIESESIVASKILLTAFAALPLPTKNVVQHRKHIYDTWKSMETIKVLVEIRLQQEACVQDPVVTDRFIQECFCCYVKLTPALEKTTNFNSMEEYLKLIDWADRILVTSLPMECPYINERSHFEWLMMNTTGQLTVTLLNQILEALLIMTDKGQICLSLIHKGVRICKKALRTGCRLMFVSSCIKFTSKLYNSFKRNLDARAFFKTQHMLLHLLTDCISSFSDCIPVKDYLKPGLKDYEEIESIVRNVLLSSMKLCGTSAKLITSVVKTFIDVILRVMDREESVVSTSELRDAQDLPFIAARFVALFCSSPNLSEVFLVTLMHVISEDCKEAQQLIAGFKLLHVLVLCDGYFKHEILTAAIGKAEAVVRCIQSTISSRTDRDLVEMMETVVKSAKQHLCVHDSNHEIIS
ncbi:uncharacterized protein LOC126480851 [Schistocerca serialis cubense]|uniref:uncharacterized protein LOC126480851 n=1 Tax=Schistocerca serialis cubense TaxID=2023355 RepID=UPI00214EB6EB|nr:uncharacterized protein LOC126480851 [Schistocerca serialis cubense]